MTLNTTSTAGRYFTSILEGKKSIGLQVLINILGLQSSQRRSYPEPRGIAMTQMLVNIFGPIKIEVDFIVGGMRYYSLREHDEFCFRSRDTANYEPIYYHRDPFANEPELER
nr:hypothetical protein [Desulfosporosinus sp.]